MTQKVSDIEEGWKEHLAFIPPVNSRLTLTLPVVELDFGAPTVEGSARRTARYCSSPLDDAPVGVQVCLNDPEVSESLIVRCLWGPDGEQVCECDVQIALDPTVFVEPDKRVPWESGTRRVLVSDPLVNFYSSRLAGHTPEKSWQGPMFEFAVPTEVLDALYCDFECTERQRDIDDYPPSGTQQSAAEWNLRSVRIYVRVIIRQNIWGELVSLPSDLTRIEAATLLGYFELYGIPSPGKKRRFKKTSYVPQAVIIHLWANEIRAKKTFREQYGKHGKIRFSGGLSSHYIVGNEGGIWAHVRESDVAHHAGHVICQRNEPLSRSVATEWRTYECNRTRSLKKIKTSTANPNYDTIGIEHEGMVGDPWPLKKYLATAWLLQDIYTRWEHIRLDDRRIIPHRLINGAKTCPDYQVDMARLIRYARGYRQRYRSDHDPPKYGCAVPAINAPGVIIV